MELKDQLKLFTGTPQYHTHYLNPDKSILLTDGCQFLKVKADCSWFFDHITTHRKDYNLIEESFQVWRFHAGNKVNGLIWCEDGNKVILYAMTVTVNEFPLENISVWVIDGIALLPNEY